MHVPVPTGRGRPPAVTSTGGVVRPVDRGSRAYNTDTSWSKTEHHETGARVLSSRSDGRAHGRYFAQGPGHTQNENKPNLSHWNPQLTGLSHNLSGSTYSLLDRGSGVRVGVGCRQRNSKTEETVSVRSPAPPVFPFGRVLGLDPLAGPDCLEVLYRKETAPDTGSVRIDRQS